MLATAIAADRPSARRGRVVSRLAAPAGAASSPTISSAPTTWVDSAAVAPTRSRNPKPSRRTGTPRAAATFSSTLTNSNGRAIARIAAQISSATTAASTRSEEHTSELQSRQYLVCRLLLEKKKEKIERK